MKQIEKALKIFIIAIVSYAIIIIVPLNSDAGVTVYKDGDKYVKMGGRIQLQYHNQNPDDSDTTDKIFFRRFRPYIEGSLHKDWKGKFQWDMGKAEDNNELSVKDAYLQYKGFEGMKLSLGNKKTPFSREFLTSSKKQQFVERDFVGDHNYGSPDRMLGFFVDGHAMDKYITYSFAGGNENLDPDANKLDFDTPANNDTDWNQGWIGAGRIDFHPFGHLKFSQGDFKGKTKATIGVSGFTWQNDDDNNTRTTAGLDTSGGSKPDVDSVNGFEVSGAFRAMGVSVDVSYNYLDVDTKDKSVTSGIYKNGTTKLENFAVKGGYMIIPKRLEIVAGWQFQDADNYATRWTRKSFGANLFLYKHYLKAQFTYRIANDLKGVRGKDEDEAFAQVQYVF